MQQAVLSSPSFDAARFWKEGEVEVCFRSLGHPEAYIAHYEDFKLYLTAQTERGARGALARLQIGAKSGHLGEFLGRHQPLFQDRILWLQCRHEIGLGKTWSLGIPSDFIKPLEGEDRAFMRKLASRVVELGYTALLLGSRKNEKRLSFGKEKLALLFDVLKEFGLRCFLAPVFTGQEALVFDEILSLGADGLFWESCAKKAGGQTLFEALQDEARQLEMCEEVIYSLPCKGELLQRLLDAVGTKTALAFPASTEEGKPHSFWEVLRQSPDVSSTKIYPIVNAGMCGMGDGLWPVTSLDVAEDVIGCLYRHRFGGLIGMAPALPPAGGLLDGNLWMMAQVQWQQMPPRAYLETWCRAYKPQWPWQEALEVFRISREIAGALKKWGGAAIKGLPSQGRLDVEEAVLKVRRLEGLIEQKSALYLYIEPFLVDCKRMLLALNGKVILEEKGDRGIWTEDGGLFRKEPYIGGPGDSQFKLYTENRMT